MPSTLMREPVEGCNSTVGHSQVKRAQIAMLLFSKWTFIGQQIKT